MDVQLATSQGDQGAGSYALDVTGAPTAYAYGGGPPVLLGATGLAVPPTLLVLVVGALVYFREAVGALAGRFAALFYTKLRKDKLLHDPTRETILQAIRASPGISYMTLHKEIPDGRGRGRVSFGTLSYHLSQMERFGLIVSKREGRYRRYFDVGSNLGADAARVALLQTAPVPLVARAILDRPGLNQSQLFEALACEQVASRQVMAYHLRRLVEKDLVAVERAGRSRRYRPTERLLRLAGFLDFRVPAADPVATSPRIEAAGSLPAS